MRSTVEYRMKKEAEASARAWRRLLLKLAPTIIVATCISLPAVADVHRPRIPDSLLDWTQANSQALAETVPPAESSNDFSSIGDSVDLYTGRLLVNQTDLVIPGIGPEIRIERSWQGSNADYANANLVSEFADWALNVPRIEGVVPQPGGTVMWPNNRCSQFGVINFSTNYSGFTVPGDLINQGFTLYYGGRQQTMLRAASGIFPSGTVAATKDFTAISCLGAIANGSGEGFKALTSDGTTILFNRIHFQGTSAVVYPSSYPDGSYQYWQRSRAIMLATSVTDRFGNHIDYNYDSNGNLTSITGSDGRSVSFTYTQKLNYFPSNGYGSPSGTSPVIETMTANGKTWTYGYDTTSLAVDCNFSGLCSYGTTLSTIERPDGSNWTFSLADIVDGGTNTFVTLTQGVGTITSPSGARAEFTVEYWFGSANFPRGNVPVVQFNSYFSGGPSWSFIYANIELPILLSKTITGPNLSSQTWTYSRVHYPTLKGWYQGQTPGISDRVVTINSPEGVFEKYYYSVMFDATEGSLLKHEIYATSTATTPLRTTVYTYSPGTVVGTISNPTVNAASAAQAPRPTSIIISQNGTTFSTRYTSFDSYNNPLTIERDNSFTATVTETRTYHHDTTAWVLGQLATSSKSGTTSESYTYDSATNEVEDAYSFGFKTDTFDYYSNGTLKSRTDGNSHATGYSDYYRGLPRTTTYADTKTLVLTVNPDGTVATSKSPRGNTTTFGYDALSRLNSVVYPTADTVAWGSRTTTYTKLSAVELGMPVGTWRIRTTEGAMRRSDYLDGLQRLILREEKDTGSGGIATYFRKSYDSNGRVTFQSYPSATSSASSGINMTYDALGRLKTRATTGGVSLQTVTYLSNNRQSILDGDSNTTTYTYQAFGTPDTTQVVKIEAPETQTTTITRDVFGHVKSAVQSGGGSSATRTYIYDSNLRVCKSIDPESGQSVIAYDPAGQVQWTASGQGGSITTCDYASVPTNAKTTYGYDPVGRQTSVDYADASGNVILGYDDDGHLTSVANPTATWTWTYNKRGLLETETAVIDSQTFLLTHGYNTQGLQSSLTYPDSTAISYSPDAWGRPTKLGTLATSITYHPNGIPHTYTLGNSLGYSATLNARQWIDTAAVTSGATLQSFHYEYSVDGDVEAITDNVDGTNSASLSYDGLHRIEVASGCWGDYGYEYDSIGNIKSRLGTNSLAYDYNTNNRLHTVGVGDDIFTDGFDNVRSCQSSSAITRNYVYDARGRPTTDGSKSFVWNLADQMTSVTGVATYKYDGRNKRIKTTQTAGGSVEYALYDLSGQLIYTQKGSTKTDYVSLAGKPVAKIATTGTTYLHPDVLGSPRMSTNSAGAVLWHEHYDPFGVKADNVAEKVGYTSHAFDPETRLTYAQARYYDAAIGRFLSKDPKQFDPNIAQSFNRYAYVRNNPYRYIDPDGRFESSPWLLATVPGQGSYDNAMTSWENGNYWQTALYGTAMLTEQVLTVATFGMSGAAAPTARVVGSEASALAQRAKQIHDVLDPIAQRQRTTAVLRTDMGDIIAGGARDLTRAQREATVAGEMIAREVGAHAEATALNAAQRIGATPQAMSVTRSICPTCAAMIEAAGGKLTNETTVIWKH